LTADRATNARGFASAFDPLLFLFAEFAFSATFAM
jgi:hypothetical protein